MQTLDSAYIENYKDYYPCDLIDIAKRRGIYASEVQDQILEFHSLNPDADLQTISITDDPEAIEKGTDVLLITNQGTFVLYPDGETESVDNESKIRRSQAAKKGSITKNGPVSQCVANIKQLLGKAELVDDPRMIRVKNKPDCVLIYVYPNQYSTYALHKHQRGDFKELEEAYEGDNIGFHIRLSDSFQADVTNIAKSQADKFGLDVECGYASALMDRGKLAEHDVPSQDEYYACIIILSQPR